MVQLLLTVNVLIKYEESGVIERILWISDRGDYCYTIDINNNSYPEICEILAIKNGLDSRTVSVTTDENNLATIAETLSAKELEYQERAWNVIQMIATKDNEPAIYIPKYRKHLINEASIKFNISEKSISRYLKQYWKNGKTKQALLPQFSNCGGRGKEKKATKKMGKRSKYRESGIIVTEEVKNIFRWSLNKYYYKKGKATLKFAYEQMLKEYFSKGYREKNGILVPILKEEHLIPTFDQFRYFYRKENQIKKEISSRKGWKNYDLNYRSVLGSSTHEVMGPGSRFQIDGTSFDIYLISEFDGSVIGRPCLFYVQDVFSRMVVGMYIGLETSWVSIMMAIANASEDKVSFCKRYGVEITQDEWPAYYLPETLIGDRGELFSNKAEALISELGVRVENTTSYRGDLKGIVERHFRTTNDYVKPLLPGSIDVDFRKRGGRDYRLDAKLNIKQFTAIIIKCVLHHNNHHYLSNYNREEMMLEDKIKPIPIEIWNWGIKNRSGKLKVLPYDKILLNLMPKSQATITYLGIRFKGMYYNCGLAKEEHWFQKARSYGSWKMSVSYDPRNMSKIYLRGVGQNGYETAYLLNHQSRYENKSIEDIVFLHESEKQLQVKQQGTELKSKVQLQAEIEAIVNEAEFNQKTTIKSDRKQIKDIRANRLIEKEEARKREVFDLEQEYEKELGLPLENVESNFSYFDDFDLLLNKQKEQQSDE